MGVVVKKGGRKQAFVAAKIKHSIEKAAKEAKYSASEVKKLVKEVAEPVIELYKKKRSVKVSELRRSILGRLERKAKRAVTAWKRYDKKK